MEINVWTRRSALAVVLGLSLSLSSTGVQRQEGPISSYDVHASDAISTSTSKTIPDNERNILRIRRNQKTAGKAGESRFGVIAYEGEILCYTLEHESVKIPAGTYRGELRWSERFQETVPYIHIPKRSGIEIHRGNCPVDSGGCVLVGTTIGGACLHSSKLAFGRIMKVLPQEFTVVVE